MVGHEDHGLPAAADGLRQGFPALHGPGHTAERELLPALLESGKTLIVHSDESYHRKLSTPTRYVEVHRDCFDGLCGVARDELDAHFQLHKAPLTYCVGEMLDWEAPTGGYLLQACFSTAVHAARHLASVLKTR